MNIHYRQGDVLIERVPLIPKTTKLQKGPVILAHGTATGHSHAINSGAKLYADPKAQTVFVRVTAATADVTHEEHGPITLPKGSYQITRQREYTPTEIRNVAD